MTKYYFFGFLLLISSCTPSSQDADFKLFTKSFHQSKWKQFPLWAAKAGHKQFDKFLPIPNREKHFSNLQFCKKYHDTLQTFDPSRLSVPLQFEYNKIKPFLSKYIDDFENLKIHEIDPTYYDLHKVFAPYGKNLSQEEMKILESKLKVIPEYYAAAKQNLNNPDPIKLQESIQQQIQFYATLDQLSADKNLISKAKLSVKDFIAFCRSEEFEFHEADIPTAPSNEAKKVLTVEK